MIRFVNDFKRGARILPVNNENNSINSSNRITVPVKEEKLDEIDLEFYLDGQGD